MSTTAMRSRQQEPDAVPVHEGESALLRSYAISVSLVAAVIVLVATLVFPILPTVALTTAWIDTGLQQQAGFLFWIAFGLIGSAKAHDLPGGAVITFHMPFVVAGTIVSGPVVGAWMGVISQFELRELRQAPWYGTTANHAIVAIAAVAGGVAGLAVAEAVGAPLLGSDPLVRLLVSGAVALVFIVVNASLVLPIIAMRNDVTLRVALRAYHAPLRATMPAEAVLAWLMAITYLRVAWWAPILCVVLALVIWQAHDRLQASRHDPMTGLLNDAGIAPLLQMAHRRARVEGQRHAILFIDLDDFGILNKVHGSDVGDQMIRAAANRMRLAVRSTDAVARQNRAGDEFLILLTQLPDDATAEKLAWRISERICQPLQVRGSDTMVQVGASIGIAMIEPFTEESLESLKRLADQRMQTAKRGKTGVLR